MARRTAADVRAELSELQTRYEAVVTRGNPADNAAELAEQDGKIAELLAEYSAIRQHEGKVSSNRQAMAEIFNEAVADVIPTREGHEQARREVARTFGERFVSDPAFKAWHTNLTGNGTRIPSRDMSIQSPTVDIHESMIQRAAAVITGLSSTSGGALVVNERSNYLVPAVRDEMRVVDLLTRQTTNSDAIEYVRVTTETNAAAPVLEATAVNDGGKPESSVALAVVTAIVETIAHYVNITRRAAADANQIRSYIDDFLMWGLMDVLNDQIINGTGTTPQLPGIDDLANTQSQAFSNNVLETLRKARTLVRTTGGARPTAYVMNPLDWEAIDLLQDNEGRYFYGGPMALGQPVLWGLPVVEDEAVAEGLAFVGDWKMGILWDREQANILMTDSHSDYFIRNILTLLAEMRVGLGWLRPAAFVEADISA